jgi:hypothetical protein
LGLRRLRKLVLYQSKLLLSLVVGCLDLLVQLLLAQELLVVGATVVEVVDDEPELS